MSDINEEKMQRVVEQMKEDNIKFIRLQFVDINGTVKNIVIPFNGDDMSETLGKLFSFFTIDWYIIRSSSHTTILLIGLSIFFI